jgi:hypothetical protein
MSKTGVQATRRFALRWTKGRGYRRRNRSGKPLRSAIHRAERMLSRIGMR